MLHLWQVLLVLFKWGSGMSNSKIYSLGSHSKGAMLCEEILIFASFA